MRAPFAAAELASTTRVWNSPRHAWQLYNVGYISNDQKLHFEQTADIDLGVAPWNDGDGWPGIGSIGITDFNAVVDGAGFAISNMTISASRIRAGLFSRVEGATLQSIALENVNIETDGGFAGALLGAGDSGGFTYIIDSYATGTITVDDQLFGDAPDTDDRRVGGLVGYGNRTRISGSFADVTVNNTGERTGVLVGYTEGTANDAIEASFALGKLTGDVNVGGLVGFP